jgi:hypothetical protein
LYTAASGNPDFIEYIDKNKDTIRKNISYFRRILGQTLIV